jgi:probable phosphoglycerate mutase
VAVTVMLLVRHATHGQLGHRLCGRMPGVDLGPEGKAEARRLAGRIASIGISAVYSSPLERTWQTAEAIGAATGVPVQAENDLLEIDFGRWTGASFDELAADPDWPDWNGARSQGRTPGGESMAQVQARVARCVDRLIQQHPDETVALVSHADVLKTALAHALGLSMDFHHRFDISPASLSVLVAGSWGMKVQAMNEVVR